MTQVIQAVYENGVLRPLETIHLIEHQQVRITIEGMSKENAENSDVLSAEDPLRGFRVSLGIPDLSENFNDYRFGRRKP
ncbi:MAG TPA: antitoxin family protein [Thermoguttaceae bacterium]